MAHLAISLLGPFRVTLDGEPITRFRANTAQALLAYLAMHPGVEHRRESLAALLWPDSPEPVARQNLRQTLRRLRTAILDSETNPPTLQATRSTLALNAGPAHWLDVANFSEAIAASQEHAHRHLQRGSHDRAVERWQHDLPLRLGLRGSPRPSDTGRVLADDKEVLSRPARARCRRLHSLSLPPLPLTGHGCLSGHRGESITGAVVRRGVPHRVLRGGLVG